MKKMPTLVEIFGIDEIEIEDRTLPFDLSAIPFSAVDPEDWLVGKNMSFSEMEKYIEILISNGWKKWGHLVFDPKHWRLKIERMPDRPDDPSANFVHGDEQIKNLSNWQSSAISNALSGKKTNFRKDALAVGPGRGDEAFLEPVSSEAKRLLKLASEERQLQQKERPNLDFGDADDIASHYVIRGINRKFTNVHIGSVAEYVLTQSKAGN